MTHNRVISMTIFKTVAQKNMKSVALSVSHQMSYFSLRYYN